MTSSTFLEYCKEFLKICILIKNSVFMKFLQKLNSILNKYFLDFTVIIEATQKESGDLKGNS